MPYTSSLFQPINTLKDLNIITKQVSKKVRNLEVNNLIQFSGQKSYNNINLMYFPVIFHGNSKKYAKSIISNCWCKSFFIVYFIDLNKTTSNQTSFVSSNTIIFGIFNILYNFCYNSIMTFWYCNWFAKYTLVRNKLLF